MILGYLIGDVYLVISESFKVKQAILLSATMAAEMILRVDEIITCALKRERIECENKKTGKLACLNALDNGVKPRGLIAWKNGSSLSDIVFVVTHPLLSGMHGIMIWLANSMCSV